MTDTNNAGNTGDKTATKSPLRRYAEAALIAILIALIARTFIMQAYRIPSGSMRNTLLIGDYILIDKIGYRFTAPKSGDIVVFKYPLQDNDISFSESMLEIYELIVHRKRTERKDYIKRIIAGPGDIVTGRDGRVIINGQILEEPYVEKIDVKPFGPYEVPDDNYFVMGDNRTDSYDSRDWGYVHKDLIKGKAVLVYWSWIPDNCQRHIAEVKKPNQRDIEGLITSGFEENPESIYICEGGGEILQDWFEVRKCPWYTPWKRVRWSRVLHTVG